MANRYWIGGSGTWSDSSHWSGSSGGGGGASVPSPSDDVIFNAASFSANNQVVTLASDSGNIFCKSINTVGVDRPFVFDTVAITLYLYGDATLSPNLSLKSPGHLKFMIVGNVVFTQNGAELRTTTEGSDIYILNSSSQITLGGPLSISSIYQRAGTLITNGQELTTTSFFMDAFTDTSLNITGSTMNIIEGTGPDSSFVLLPGPGVLTASGSTLFLKAPSWDYSSGGRSLPDVRIVAPNVRLIGNNTFGTLTAKEKFIVESGKTQTVGTLSMNGSVSTPIKLRSSTPGSPATLSKSSGMVNTSYLDIQDSIATGGATWNAANSINSGNNTGWNFVNSVSRTISGTFLLSGSISSTKIKVPTIDGTFLLGGGVSRQQIHARAVSGGFKLGGSVNFVVLRDTQAIEEKRYLYKVYDESGTYIETWPDVIDVPEFTTEINELGSSTTVHLARNSDSVGVSTAVLQTQAGTTITTQDTLDLLVTTESRNQVGPGSSVQHNNRVDIIVFYGEVSALLTEAGAEITLENGEVLQASIGAPNGRRLFTGFISEINQRYGNSETTVVQLSSYGFDLDQFVLDDTSGNTTVTFNSTDPSVIAQMALDRFATVSAAYGTYTRRTSTSISLSGTVVSYTFKVNKLGDVLKKVLELLPPNWYFYVGLGDNTVYFRQRATTPAHLFYLGKHIKSLDLKSSIIGVKNDVYTTGGGEPALFMRHTEAPAPRTRRGLHLTSDSRLTVEASADIMAEGLLEENNKVLYRTTVEVLSKVYDIESINVGDMVGFRNFNNNVDSLILQAVGINYTPDQVTLALQQLPPNINKRVEDLRRNQLVADNQTVPNAPIV